MEDLSGMEFGPYRVVEPLGEGGMAAVYKAYQPAVERYVAIKVLPRRYAEAPEFDARFEREAKLLASLQHPHILPVFDFGQSEGHTFIVMPFVDGGTLADRLKGQPLALSDIREAVVHTGQALDFAHERGLIHRDVKPSNVLIDEGGNYLLADFGLARMIEPSIKLTNPGAVLGTPAYMSPEQGAGQKIDRRSDIYSLGVILYEMATGRVPYQAETPMAVIFKHLHDPLPRPRKLNPDLSEAIELVIHKALAKDPAGRFQTARELVDAIQTAIPQSLDVAQADRVEKNGAISRGRQGVGRTIAPTGPLARLSSVLPMSWVRLAGLLMLLAVGVVGAALALRAGGPGRMGPVVSSLLAPGGGVSDDSVDRGAPQSEKLGFDDTVEPGGPGPPLESSPTPAIVGAVVDYSEDFSGFAYGWNTYGGVSFTEHTVQLQGNAGMSQPNAVLEGTSIVMSFSHTPGEFSIYLADDPTDYDTKAGVHISEGGMLTTSVAVDGLFVGGKRLLGDLRLVPGGSYLAMIEIREGGSFRIRVWDREDPGQYREAGVHLGDEWEGHSWYPTVTADSGILSIDYYQELIWEGARESELELEPEVDLQGEGTLHRLQLAGLVRLGIANEEPYSFANPDGTLSGESIDIAKYVFGNLGVPDIDVVVTEFGSLIPALQDDRFDVISAGMWIRPDRCEQVIFADPEFKSVVEGETWYGAAGFRKEDDDLRDAFNAELQKLKDSGQLGDIIYGYTGYFGVTSLPGEMTAQELCNP